MKNAEILSAMSNSLQKKNNQFKKKGGLRGSPQKTDEIESMNMDFDGMNDPDFENFKLQNDMNTNPLNQVDMDKIKKTLIEEKANYLERLKKIAGKPTVKKKEFQPFQCN